MALDDSESDTVAANSRKGALDPPKAHTVRTFLFGLSTDAGPKLLAFQMANIMIGRLPDNHLSLNHGSVSRRHAKIAVTPKGVMIEDMGSQNGTTINGVEVKAASPIRPGDIIRIGYVPLFYFGFMQPDNPPTVDFVDGNVAFNPTTPPI